MTVRLDAATRNRLERLSRATARTKAYLAQEAIRAYIEQNEWQVTAIEEGVHAAEHGRLVEHEVVDEWLASWGGGKEKKPPR
jgi:predicted transcriptional regulator